MAEMSEMAEMCVNGGMGDWVNDAIRFALAEDVGAGDVTSAATLPADLRLSARVVAKADGVVAGLVLAVLAFDTRSGDPELAFFSDGVSDEIRQAVSRGLAYAAYADLIWCETGKPELAFAKAFPEAIQAKFPGKMLRLHTPACLQRQEKRRPPHILVTTPESLTLLLSQPAWLVALRERFSSCTLFAVGYGDSVFLGASPERLVRDRGRLVTLGLPPPVLARLLMSSHHRLDIGFELLQIDAQRRRIEVGEMTTDDRGGEHSWKSPWSLVTGP